MKFNKQLLLTLFLLIFSFLMINCVGPVTPEINNGEATPPIVNPDEGAEQTPSGGSQEENNPVEQYKPEPENILDDGFVKLNRQNIKYEENNNQMYIMVRFLGKSEKNFWRVVDMDKQTAAFPKGFVFYYKGIEVPTVNNFNELDESLAFSVGYDSYSGFSDVQGSKLYTTFYYGEEHMKTPMNGSNDITFTYDSFVIWDPTITGELMGHPDFVRYPTGNPFSITIPMKDFDSKIHKNIAYITVYFEPDKGYKEGLIPYKVVLDGFEPK